MVREPIGEIEAWSCSCVESIHWDGITIEIIKHYGLNRWFGHATNFEAVGSKVVSEKLNRFAIDNKFFMSRHQCYKTHLAIGKLRAKCVSQPVTLYKEPQAFVALFGIVVVEIILVNGGGRFGAAAWDVPVVVEIYRRSGLQRMVHPVYDNKQYNCRTLHMQDN